MNSVGFFLGNIAKSLGIRRARRRWEAVTHERSLLKDAEDLLGKMAWEDAEDIDELATEYWRIKELTRNIDKIRMLHDDLDNKTGSLEVKQYDLTDEMEEGTSELLKQRDALHRHEEEINVAIDNIRGDAELIKKKFDGLKLKLKVYEDEGRSGVECDEIRANLDSYKKQFEGQKDALRMKKEEVAQAADDIQELDSKIQGVRGQFDDQAVSLTSEMGQHAKQVARYSAEISALEREKYECQAAVGTHLSQQAMVNPDLRRKLKKYSPLLGKIEKLVKSIDYNQRLASY